MTHFYDIFKCFTLPHCRCILGNFSVTELLKRIAFLKFPLACWGSLLISELLGWLRVTGNEECGMDKGS